MTDAPQGIQTPRTGRPRRIAFCITDLDVGGAERCLVNLACQLDRDAWSSHVFCLRGRGALVDRLDASGIPCTCLGWRGTRDVWRMFELVRKLRAWRPELLQTFLFHGNLAGRIAGRLAGVPVIVSGIRVAEREKRWHVKWEKLTRRLVTHHVCVSRAVAEFSIREAGLRTEAVSVIPNGVDVAQFADALPYSNEELGAPAETRWIIAVGRLHPQKGHLLLIDAAAPVLRANPDWRLMIVGEGPLREHLEREIDAVGCREQIAILGFRNDVPRLLKSADVFVLPSLWEGQPNVVLEALAAGLPVIATDVEGVRELLEPVHTGVIIDPGDVESLRNSLLQLVKSGPRPSATTRKLQPVAAQLVTTAHVARQYADLYERLLRKSRN